MNTSTTNNLLSQNYYNSSSSAYVAYNATYRQEPLANRRAKETIISFKLLNENWDSYGASAPSEIAIKKALSFIKRLSQFNTEVFFVAPTPNGDILVEVKQGNANLEFEFMAEGDDTICASENGEYKSEEKLNTTTFTSYLKWLICPDGNCPPNL